MADLDSMAAQYGVQDDTQPPVNSALMNMLSAYGAQPSSYTQEIADARQRAQEQQAKLEAAVRASYANVENKPSKAELYFNLAQSFLSPTKSGRFTENLGNAAGVAGNYAAETRKANQEAAKARLAGETQLAQFGLANTKEDLGTLRALDASERQDRRALQTELVKQYFQSGKAQSDYGKRAMDAGYRPGTPEFNKAVQGMLDQAAQNGSLYKDAMLGLAQQRLAMQQQNMERLSPKEMDEAFNLQTSLKAADNSEQLLKNALAQVDKAYTAAPADQLMYKKSKLINPQGDPRVKATEVLEQLLTESALAGLKASFGGNPTEGERAVALLTKGLQASTATSRREQINNALKMLQNQRKLNAQQLEDIRTGKYRTYVPGGSSDLGTEGLETGDTQ